MDRFIRKKVLSMSGVPETHAFDFWNQHHGFSVDVGRKRVGMRWTSSEFRKPGSTFYSVNYFIEISSAVYKVAVNLSGGDSSALIVNDRSDLTANNPSRRFASILFGRLVESYSTRRHTIDIDYFCDVIFDQSVRPIDKGIGDVGVLREVGFSGVEICMSLYHLINSEEFLYEIDKEREDRINVDEKIDKNNVKSAGSIREYFDEIKSFFSGDEEGVPDERVHQVHSEDSKLNRGVLPVIFEGSLDRAAMARALAHVMQERGLSVRKAAEAAGVGAKDIQRITNGEATIEKSIAVLSELGCQFSVRIGSREPQ